jgi:hypothetical protein
MAPVAPPRCRQRRVIFWPVFATHIDYLSDCQAACFFTTRVVAFYAASKKLPVQNRQLLAVPGMFATEDDKFLRVSG